VGAANSSNSNRLRDLAEEMGTTAHLINGAEDIDENWLAGVASIGITAGASAPEILVEKVIERLCELKDAEVETMNGVIEKTKFKLPLEVLEKTLNTSQMPNNS